MKTVVIYDADYYGVRFVVFDGDYRHLDNVYINVTEDERLLEEVNSLLFDEDINDKVEFTKNFPTQAVVDGAFVIVVGFLS